MQPLCFVLMPFGRKNSGAGQTIDFDQVYEKIIKTAVVEAGLEPIRADEEAAGGIIHKPMFERLVLCDFAVADLTTANANVFYELGVRHAAKPRSTVLLFAEGHGRLPFDVAQLRAYPYSVDANAVPDQVDKDRAAVSEKLKHAASAAETDSPLWQLLDGYPDRLDHTKTDAFRERVLIEKEIKDRLAAARNAGTDEVKAIEVSLGSISQQDPGVVVDLLLSYRATSGWQEMVDLVGVMDATLANTVLVREQLGLALNRLGRRGDAQRVLTKLIEERGPSSETNGILGRVYKDRWRDALNAGQAIAAAGNLEKAIETYKEGFEDDWRDAYPGINTLTLMRISGGYEREFARLLPVVRYSVQRKLAGGEVDYWDHATLFELAVLEEDERAAVRHLADMLANIREEWELETTLNNIRLITECAQVVPEWVTKIIREAEENS